jgi:LytS/YehU family sensor histidine kinase
VATLLAVAFVGCLLTQVIFQVAGFPAGRGPYWLTVFSSYRAAALITIVVGVIGMITESYRIRLEKTTAQLREREIERERLMKLANEAQLASIESRIQPHFLFNTLNSISSLIREEPDKAERLIERLSALLRSSLDTHQVPLVPLSQEIKLVEDYLEIQHARFGERLRYRIDVPRELADWGVPPFSVQTLVENSVKHAIAPRREGGSVEVAARATGDRAMVEVRDDGPGFEAAALPPGHGLDNLHSRLMAVFGADAGFDVNRLDGGVRVAFSLPRRQPQPVEPA